MQEALLNWGKELIIVGETTLKTRNPTNHVQPNNLSLPKHNHLDHINQPNNNIPNPAIQNIATLHVQNSHNHTIHPNQASTTSNLNYTLRTIHDQPSQNEPFFY